MSVRCLERVETIAKRDVELRWVNRRTGTEGCKWRVKVRKVPQETDLMHVRAHKGLSGKVISAAERRHSTPYW